MVRVFVLLALAVISSQSAFTAESLQRVYLRLTVILSDAEGDRLVPGLRKDDFQVFVQGIPQFVEYFSAAPSPSSVTILLDMDGSMQSIDLKSTLDSLINICNLQLVPDETSLIAFSRNAAMVKSFSWRVKNIDFSEVIRLLKTDHSNEETGLVRALSLSQTKALAQARNHNQAVILITDAEQDFSHSTAMKIQDQIKRLGWRVYGIFFPGKRRLDYGRMHELVVQSGGRYFRISEPEPLELILRWILHELRYQYVIGFTPRSNPFETQDRISVRLTRAGPNSGVSVRFTSTKAKGRIRRNAEGS